jgi:hypothetical protein
MARMGSLHSLFSGREVYEGMVMRKSMCEIHKKICPARIVMYSQRHVC